jgi:hypothetical protein
MQVIKVLIGGEQCSAGRFGNGGNPEIVLSHVPGAAGVCPATEMHLNVGGNHPETAQIYHP